MSTEGAPRLGVDYVLGTFFGVDGKPYSVRLIPAPARTDPSGVAALQETVGAGVKKFVLVPVPEGTDLLPALLRQIEALQTYRESLPKCAICGASRVDICPVCGS